MTQQRGRRLSSGLALPVACALALILGTGTSRAECADLALVLAIDASGSIAAPEFALQQQGYAQAFLDPRVQSALAAAGVVDVGLVLWGDSQYPPHVLSWQRLRGVADAAALSQRIAGTDRDVTGNTGIGRGVQTAIDLLQDPGQCALRRVINVSGDGRESLDPFPNPQVHVPLVLARKRAEDLGITINALAILTDEPDLADWYEKRLITGPGAFVMQVDSFDSFAEAIERKLAREIAPVMLSALEP